MSFYAPKLHVLMFSGILDVASILLSIRGLNVMNTLQKRLNETQIFNLFPQNGLPPSQKSRLSFAVNFTPSQSKEKNYG